jgi:iron complex outermembrane recepter protein
MRHGRSKCFPLSIYEIERRFSSLVKPENFKMTHYPGDNIPGIPQNKFKIGFDYTVLPHWTVGADFIYNSSRYYFGDEINALPPVPGFYQINLRTAYQINKTVQIYGIIENVTDNRYYTYGTLYPTDSTLNANTGAPVPGLFNSTDPRAVTIAAPLCAYAGIKITF